MDPIWLWASACTTKTGGEDNTKQVLTLAVVLIALVACAAPTDPSAPTPGEVGVVAPAGAPDASLPTVVAAAPTPIAAAPTPIAAAPTPVAAASTPFAAASTRIAAASTRLATALPVDPSLADGWRTYTNAVYGFSFAYPEDWSVEEIAADDPLLGGHLLNVHPQDGTRMEDIRMAFRRAGDETMLWPTGVGQGDFVPQGALDVSGQPARRMLLVCPSGEVTAIWYHQSDDQPTLVRSDLEIGIIFAAGSHCEPGHNLAGVAQQVGETIIASLEVP